MASWSADESGGERRRGRVFSGVVVVCPSHHYAWWSLAFPGMAEHLSVHGKGWRNSLFSFACAYSFCFTYETIFISVHKFSRFYPSKHLPCPTPGVKCLHGTYLQAGVKPHNLKIWALILFCVPTLFFIYILLAICLLFCFTVISDITRFLWETYTEHFYCFQPVADPLHSHVVFTLPDICSSLFILEKLWSWIHAVVFKSVEYGV